MFGFNMKESTYLLFGIFSFFVSSKLGRGGVFTSRKSDFPNLFLSGVKLILTI